MCFYVHKNHKKVKIAKKDIFCYKILDRYGRGIYRLKKYKLLQDAEVNEEGGWVFGGSIYGSSSLVESGVLHSYSTLQETFNQMNYLTLDDKMYSMPFENSKYKIHCFVIPRGTEYMYNPLHKEYVSKTLKYVGKV